MSVRRRKIAQRVNRNPKLLKQVLKRESYLAKYIRYQNKRHNYGV